MATDHLLATTSLFDLFHESQLRPDEILTILCTLDDTNGIFSAATPDAFVPLLDEKNSSISSKNKRRKHPDKMASSLPPDEESVVEDHVELSKRNKCVKRQKASASPLATSVEVDGSNSNNGKVVSHITVERKRRKQMNEHLVELRQLMPCFYVKKGDQASIIEGAIDYINELQQVLQSLEAKKQRKIYTNEVGQSPRIESSPKLVPQQHYSPLINFSFSPTTTPQSTSGLHKPLRRPLPSATIASPTSTSDSSCSSIADMIIMLNSYNNNISCNNGIANELVATSNGSVANVEVKFCGPYLELKTLSSKLAGQTVKIVSTIEDLALEILQVSINTVDETMLNAFTIKIGIDCQLSAEELAHQILQTFC